MRIAVLQQKGGSGKTTLATNLAAAAHLDGLRTLLIDMDRQGSALDWAAARVARDTERPDGQRSKLDGIQVEGHSRGLSLPRINEITEGFGAVIIDGPPRLDEVTRSAAAAADVAVLPVQPGPFDFWAFGATIDALDQADRIRAELGRGPVRRLFVINRAPVRSRLAAGAETQLRAEGYAVACTVHQRVAFPAAALSGESVFHTPGALLAASEIERLWRAVKAAANGNTQHKSSRSRSRKKAGRGKAQ